MPKRKVYSGFSSHISEQKTLAGFPRLWNGIMATAIAQTS
jgi:hypothetical protein